MKIAPFGVLSNERLPVGQDIYTPMETWPDHVPLSQYKSIIDEFMELAERHLAPKWAQTDWSNGYAGDYEATTKAELEIIVREYFNPSSDIIHYWS